MNSAKNKRTRTQSIALAAVLIALLTVSCFVTIPIGPVPFTLQTAVVILVALLCTPKEAAATTGIYLLMGAAGLPVFSAMTGGIIRPTTGFLAGFLIGSVAASALRMLLMRGKAPKLAADIAAAVVYMVIADALGLLWYTFFAHVAPGEAFVIMLAPFLVVDCIKAAIAIGVAASVRKGLGWE